MNNYKELKIWQNGMEIVKLIFDLVKNIPSEDIYTLRSQVIRSSISIPSNIAEGTSRRSQKEFKRYIEIALGSSFELETQILIVKENNLIRNYNFEILLNKISEEQKMMYSFKNKLSN